MSESAMQPTQQEEVMAGQRFAFGPNWAKFLQIIDEKRILQATSSLQSMLEVDNLEGKSFLDIGCGSGLFSLSAMRMGARVVSFDYDPESVACTNELKRRYCPDESQWIVKEGSALDAAFLQTLGKFDIVYSWGVLHHTGDMWTALENIEKNVTASGKLFVALYNDQGRMSKVWLATKRVYCALPSYLRWLILIPCYLRLWGPTTVRDFVLARPFATWREYKRDRGMSPHIDVVDWVGGLPFDVSSPEQIFEFYTKRNFKLTKLKTCGGGHGCNEFVFQHN